MSAAETQTPLVDLTAVHVEHSAPGGGMLSRQRVHALTDVSFAITRGETVGVVGESGCGKSTLAKVLIGLQKPTRGDVKVGGDDLWRMQARERRRRVGRGIGVIFQDPSTSLNQRMPVGQILRDPLDVQRVGSHAEREARVLELLDLVGLPRSQFDALPAQLSGGQRQRIAIARALALEPQLIVADEPTSALDVSVRAQILNLLIELKDRLGLAMVYISHDIQTVRFISDRLVTMYLGRIVEETPVQELGATRHPYTRALLSATPTLRHEVSPIPLAGPVPSAVDPPSGCPFRTRCWRAADDCSREMPPFELSGADPTHRFRCFHPVDSDTEVVYTHEEESG